MKPARAGRLGNVGRDAAVFQIDAGGGPHDPLAAFAGLVRVVSVNFESAVFCSRRLATCLLSTPTRSSSLQLHHHFTSKYHNVQGHPPDRVRRSHHADPAGLRGG
jgi:hypothetical protein